AMAASAVGRLLRNLPTCAGSRSRPRRVIIRSEAEAFMSNPLIKPGTSIRRRPVMLGNPKIRAIQVGSAWHVDAVTPLDPVPARFTDRLRSGAHAHPERTLVARRGADGAWIRISYGSMLERVRC